MRLGFRSRFCSEKTDKCAHGHQVPPYGGNLVASSGGTGTRYHAKLVEWFNTSVLKTEGLIGPGVRISHFASHWPWVPIVPVY